MSKRVIVEYIADSSRSGAPVHVLNILKNINRDEFVVSLICPEGYLADEAKALGIQVVAINLFRPYDMKNLKIFRDVISKINPDVVHVHGFRAGFISLTALKNIKTKTIYTEHLYTKDFHLNNILREKLQHQVLKKISIFFDEIICPSQAVKDFILALNSSAKTLLVPNGMIPPQVVDQSPQANLFGFIGALNRNKGILELIDAMESIHLDTQDAKLEIIGDGPLLPIIEEKIKGKKYISLVGIVDDIYKYILNWNFIVVPSFSESFGQVILEAASARRSAVVNNTGALKEVVKDGVTGILLKSNNPKEIALTIKDLLQDKKKISFLGENAYKNFSDNYLADQMTRKIEKIYSVGD